MAPILNYAVICTRIGAWMCKTEGKVLVVGTRGDIGMSLGLNRAWDSLKRQEPSQKKLHNKSSKDSIAQHWLHILHVCISDADGKEKCTTFDFFLLNNWASTRALCVFSKRVILSYSFEQSAFIYRLTGLVFALPFALHSDLNTTLKPRLKPYWEVTPACTYLLKHNRNSAVI